ncbi:hypothetical protein [Nitrosomonas ureae]|uniref:Uncharacterized protein n=1 Tax=Nitrosomonas ureae TaxID=44577 RepID=A0A1H2H9S7_9PROT|nr:hypothetical protein [Nitrosomonas ureae]ALQ52163.1 hypothetical protein ATY38_13655 [Nitrosomonas ureae]SDU28631.1 hypothetical protein SAMN05216406_1443 [Nitrosomonas ureae]
MTSIPDQKIKKDNEILLTIIIFLIFVLGTLSLYFYKDVKSDIDKLQQTIPAETDTSNYLRTIDNNVIKSLAKLNEAIHLINKHQLSIENINPTLDTLKSNNQEFINQLNASLDKLASELKEETNKNVIDENLNKFVEQITEEIRRNSIQEQEHSNPE